MNSPDFNKKNSGTEKFILETLVRVPLKAVRALEKQALRETGVNIPSDPAC